ncbi:lipoprotein [uncultured Legionella sp.]|nr:lipoprotein [uncultured Legionella sp.]
MIRFSFSLSLLATLLLLAGCGQKGPLYMPGPEKKPPMTTSPKE